MAASTYSGAAVRLRTAAAEDADAVLACVVAAYSAYLERMDRRPAPMLDDYERLIADGVVRVAEVDGVLAGAIVLWPRDKHLYIDNIAVRPDVQGNGVGAALLALADDECRTIGHSELRLYTNEVMTENVRFYERRGWEETHRAVENGYRRIYFRKSID
ncbi:MAG: GNAT family N-acetyltransferase [Actinomycetota bacterium]